MAGASVCAFVARTIGLSLRSGERIAVSSGNEALPRLSIIVPARNEARQIEQCVRSLLSQAYDDFEVIAVDDRSTDETPQILERLAREDARLTLVRGVPLPEGWVGKTWAMAQGVTVAGGAWLLFTDADTVHEPPCSASAVEYAIAHGAQFVSLLPTQRFETISERIFLPTILWMIAFAVGSLDAINDPERTDAAIFNGQYLLCERRAYKAVGGHSAVRSELAEDYALARLVKNDGRFRGRLAGASDLVFTRMYRSAGEIWDGFSKNLYVGVSDRAMEGIGGALMLAGLSPVPEMLLVRALIRKRPRQAAFALACIAASAAAAEAGMARSRFPRGSGAFFPLGAAVMLAILANSTFAHARGRVSWRGREYGGRAQRCPDGDTKTPGRYGDGHSNGTSRYG